MRRIYQIYQSVGLALGATVLAGSALAQSTTLAGVSYPSPLDLQGQSLQLNGAGIRYKTVVQVYTAGLYLESKAPNAPAITELKAPSACR